MATAATSVEAASAQVLGGIVPYLELDGASKAAALVASTLPTNVRRAILFMLFSESNHFSERLEIWSAPTCRRFSEASGKR